MANELPAPILHTITHTPEGTSYVSSSAPLARASPHGPGTSAFALVHGVPRLPADLNAPPAAPSAGAFPPAPSGAVFITVDYAPGYDVPMHRTLTLDYAVVLKGEITIKTDDGVETVVRAGELLLQQGTNHQWRNRSATEWCRMLFVMVGAEPFRTADGGVLEATLPKRE